MAHGHTSSQSVHEGMKDISNAKIHLKTVNENIIQLLTNEALDMM